MAAAARSLAGDRRRASGWRRKSRLHATGTETTLEQLLSSGPQRIHLIGVCGSGMSGLARLLLAQGHAVSGSDLVSPAQAANYVPEGVRYFEGHRRSNVDGAALVVFSSAIAAENPERRAAAEKDILCVRRAECLVVLADAKSAYIVAGSHGKTTTVVDADPRAAAGRPESVPLHRRAGAAARRERGVDRRQAVRGRGGRKRRHAGALLAAGQPHPQHRGGAPRLLPRHRGDRAGLRHALRTDARPDRLLRRRQERDAALLARASRRSATGFPSWPPTARSTCGWRISPRASPCCATGSCSARSRWRCPARRTSATRSASSRWRPSSALPGTRSSARWRNSAARRAASR